MGWFEDRVREVSAVASNPVAAIGSAATALNPMALQGGAIAQGFSRLPDKTKQQLGQAAMISNPLGYLGTNISTGGQLGDMFGGSPGSSAQSQIPFQGANAAARNADLEAGYGKGKEIFYDDPDMQALRARREDLSKGYSGKELGALKAQAMSEVEGQRAAGLKKVQGNIARAGVGGARGAAIQAAADKGFQGNRAELERKMALDNAAQIRGGTKDLQDFLFSQKYGQLGTGLGYAQLGVTDRSADAQARVGNQERKKGILGSFLEDTIGGLF